MKPTPLALSVLLALCGACNSTSQSSAPAHPPTPQEIQAFTTPGEGHKVIDVKAGKWKGHIRFWMAPDAPPMESDFTTETKWIFEGHYLSDTTTGEMMGEPFKGMGMSGYDNLKKKYFFTWIDSTSTGLMTGEGTWDAKKKTITYATSMSDPMQGKVIPMRMVDTLTDANHWTMATFCTDAKGKEYKSMEINYTRAN